MYCETKYSGSSRGKIIEHYLQAGEISFNE